MIKGLMHSMTVCPDMNKSYERIRYGKGIYLYDTNGKKYIDGCSGKAAASNIGHGVKEISDALQQQANVYGLYPTHCFSSEIVEQYLSKLLAFSPEGFDRAWITTGGTEAIENAAKLAIQYQHLIGQSGRFKVISRMGSYHGNSFFALDIGGMNWRKKIYQGGMYNHPHIPSAYSYRKPPEMPLEEYSRKCASALEETILSEGPETVAAFVVEPIVAAALGAVPPPDEFYFKEIRRICTKYGVVLIADEVLTGFGRAGKNFAIQQYGIVPDIIASGKGISGGYFPIGAVIIHASISAIFFSSNNYFLSGSTYACNPMAAAVGNAVIDYITTNNLVSNAERMGNILAQKLDRLHAHSIVGDVRGKGLLHAVEFVRNKDTREPFPAADNVGQKVLFEAISRGGIFYPGKGCADGMNGDHLMIMPPLVISENQVEELVSILDKAVEKISAEVNR